MPSIIKVSGKQTTDTVTTTLVYTHTMDRSTNSHTLLGNAQQLGHNIDCVAFVCRFKLVGPVKIKASLNNFTLARYQSHSPKI